MGQPFMVTIIKMMANKIFIDNCIFSEWLDKNDNHDQRKSIEIIRKAIQQDEINAVTSIDIYRERLQNSDSQKNQKIQRGWSKVRNCGIITLNFVIGDENGTYKEYIAEAKGAWNSLSKQIYDDKDAKHIITAIYLAAANFFLTTDCKLINKMKNEGRQYIKRIEIVKPSEFIEMSAKAS